MEKSSVLLFIVVATIFYGIVVYFAIKLLNTLHKQSIKRIAEEMAKNGELTREEANAVIWLMNYKPKKKKWKNR